MENDAQEDVGRLWVRAAGPAPGRARAARARAAAACCRAAAAAHSPHARGAPAAAAAPLSGTPRSQHSALSPAQHWSRARARLAPALCSHYTHPLGSARRERALRPNPTCAAQRTRQRERERAPARAAASRGGKKWRGTTRAHDDRRSATGACAPRPPPPPQPPRTPPRPSLRGRRRSGTAREAASGSRRAAIAKRRAPPLRTAARSSRCRPPPTAAFT